jgi:hypothetical protein
MSAPTYPCNGVWYEDIIVHNIEHKCSLHDEHVTPHHCKCGSEFNWNIPGCQPWRGRYNDLVIAASGSSKIVHRAAGNGKTTCRRFFQQAPAPKGSVVTCKACY